MGAAMQTLNKMVCCVFRLWYSKTILSLVELLHLTITIRPLKLLKVMKDITLETFFMT